MDPRNTAPSDTFPDDAPASGGDEHWARPLIERQLSMLSELAEGGLSIALAIKRQVLAAAPAEEGASVASPEPDDAPEAPANPADLQGLSLAYARVSRSVRMTLALQSKVMEELRRQERIEAGLEEVAARQAAEDARKDSRARSLLRDIRKESLEGVVWRVAVGDAEGAEAAEAAERFADEANERLDDRDVYGDLLSRPMSEIVAHICRDLGLSPDWPRLAEEAWAREEIAGGALGAPLAGLKAGAWEKPQPRPVKPPDRWPTAASP